MYPNANKPEYLLCAAIHIDDGVKHVHEPSNIFTGYVVCGHRHHNCFATLDATGAKWKGLNLVQGFLSSKNRFFTREDAAELARTRKQTESDTDLLFSEDLY